MAAPRFLMPAILTLVMLIGLLGLGSWQMQRLQWKLQQIAKIEARQNTPPLRLQNQADIGVLTEAQHHYQPARLRGSFGSQQGFWYTQIHNPPSGITPQQRRGYHVLSAFYLADGAAVLIDRGFVPASEKDALPAPSQALQEIDIILRWPDKRGLFDADDSPSQNLFYVRDPKVIGQYWQLALPPVIGEMVASRQATLTWPLAGQTRLVLSNRHLQYAVTWYGLALVLVFISGLWHIRAWKQHKRQGN
jgi:surfeit locus 1 family protein